MDSVLEDSWCQKISFIGNIANENPSKTFYHSTAEIFLTAFFLT